MAGLRCMYRRWRKNGNCHLCNKKIFYLYFFSHIRLAGDRLFILCFLDECEKLHSKLQAQSTEVSLTSIIDLISNKVGVYFFCQLFFHVIFERSADNVIPSSLETLFRKIFDSGKSFKSFMCEFQPRFISFSK